MTTTLPTITIASVASDDALRAAWSVIRAKKAGPGFDAVTVPAFDAHADRYLTALGEEAVNGRYVPAPLRRICIPKPGHPGEQRALGLPSLRDKILQESVRAALEPVAEQRFANSSYGYRPGKGPVRAIARVKHHLTALKHACVLRVDVDNFFGSMRHEQVLQDVAGLGADQGVCRLVELWLRMGAVDGRGRWHDATTGTPQGSVVSPLLANIYLTPLDQAMARFDGYVRYADDVLVSGRSREELSEAAAQITQALSPLGLKLNEPVGSAKAVADGFEFLGLAFYQGVLMLAPDRISRVAATAQRSVGLAGRDPIGAARQFQEAVTGWLRYYGTVLSAPQLAPLDKAVTESWVALLRACRTHPSANTRAKSAALIGQASGIAPRSIPDEMQWRKGVVAKAWSDEVAAAAPGAPIAKARAAAHTPARTRPAPQPARPLAVATAIRQQRRAVSRQMAAQGELIVTTPGAFVGRSGDRIVVRVRQTRLAEVPVARLHAITLASEGIAVSADALTLCAARGVPVLFAGRRQDVQAMVVSPDGMPARVAALQAQAALQPEVLFDLARRFVDGKLRNQCHLLKYLGKYHRDRQASVDPLAEAAHSLDQMRATVKAMRASNGDAVGQLFGAEGRAAISYWAALAQVLPPSAGFAQRVHQGARDVTNSLLNYGYAVLKSRVHLALLKAGLNPAISFLHSPSRNDPTLVYDLVEEFRAPIVDRTVTAMLGRREAAGVDAQGLLTMETRKRLLARLHARLATVIQSRGRELTVGDVIDRQARGIVAHLEGKARYRAFASGW